MPELAWSGKSSSMSNVSGLLDSHIRGKGVLAGSAFQNVSWNKNVSDARRFYDASPEVRAVVARIGRTEDVKLSPDNRRLAVVDYFNNKVFLFSVRIELGAASPRISILDCSIIA